MPYIFSAAGVAGTVMNFGPSCLAAVSPQLACGCYELEETCDDKWDVNLLGELCTVCILYISDLDTALHPDDPEGLIVLILCISPFKSGD